MSLWRQISRGIRVLTHRTAADCDTADEVEDYLDRATDAWVARGYPPDEARRAARLEVGNNTVVREQIRAYGWENLVSALLADLRYGVRRLRSSPGFAAISVFTLALGIGASTAIFSAVSPILFEPLPYPQAGRILTIWDQGGDKSRIPVTFGSYRELLDRSRSFAALAAMKPWQPTMTGPSEPARLDGQFVSASYFSVLGVRPAIGRDFQPSDDTFNGPRVVILSDAVWRRRFGSDLAILGRQVTLNGVSLTVIGVMPAGFENVLAPAADVWAPLQYDPALPIEGREWGHHLRVAGRLLPGVGVDRAKLELDTIARTPAGDHARPAWATLQQGLMVQQLQDDVTSAVRPALLAVLGAVLLVLVIASVNVTNLLLARGAQRRGEFAMRAALGAGRLRLVRQVLTETLLLAMLAGALGMAIAVAGVNALVAVSPADLPRLNAIGIDGRVFVFAVAVTTLIGLAVGLVPALHASRGNLHGGVQESSRRTAGGHQFTRRALVVAEVALALVLLVGSGLLLRSLQRLFAIAPGFDAAHVLTLQVQTSGQRFSDETVRHQFFADALDAVRRVPGVSDAALDQPAAAQRRRRSVRRAVRVDAERQSRRRRQRLAVRRESGLFRDDADPAAARPPARRARPHRLPRGGRDQRVVREAALPRPGSDRPAHPLRAESAPLGRHRRRGRRREAGVAGGGTDRRGLPADNAVELGRSACCRWWCAPTATPRRWRRPCAPPSGPLTKTSRSSAWRRWTRCWPPRRRSGGSR